MANALSRKSCVTMSYVLKSYMPQLLAIREMGVRLETDPNGALLVNFAVRPSIIDQIQKL